MIQLDPYISDKLELTFLTIGKTKFEANVGFFKLGVIFIVSIFFLSGYNFFFIYRNIYVASVMVSVKKNFNYNIEKV